MDTVDPRIIEIALSRVAGTDFENFAQGFFSTMIGVDYVPMGGFHDGGADGAIDENIFEVNGIEKFLQASISADANRKIRHTVRRLREFGRNPKSLIYATSQKLGLIDQLQEKLSDELECRITIRDGTYFQHQVNGSPSSLQSYKAYLADAASFLNDIGSADSIRPVEGLPAKTLCVFIGQELAQRRGKTKLLESVADSLILWSLEKTDPDKNLFLTLEEIEKRVIDTLPSSKTFFRGVVKSRLDNLGSKSEGNSRKVNFHRKVKGYCLPYATREHIRNENIEDENMRLQVSDIFRSRAMSIVAEPNSNQPTVNLVVEICHAVVHKVFHAQGLEMAMFVESEDGADTNLPSIIDFIDNELHERGLLGEEAVIVSQAAKSVLRGTYYDSSPVERKYLRKLCRTYVLLFMLKNEPKIVEYFRSMTSNFDLYVGADLIVRCLSEHMLDGHDQMTKNALKLMKSSGSKLILTEKTLDEVWHHIRTTNYEFINNYKELQQLMTPFLAGQIDKILIRAFFYAKFERHDKGSRPLTWANYLGQFLSAGALNQPASRDELCEYLINEFGFEYEDENTMLTNIDEGELEKLTALIKESRNKIDRENEAEDILSRNAALTVLRIFQRRRLQNETNGGNPFGFKTWWLTQQTRVQGATGYLVSKNRARYMMRPEFILHYLSAVPSSKAVQESYDSIFPTILGVKLGNRMDETSFKKVISDARDVYNEIDESRARVLLSNLTSQLQSDFLKRYEYSDLYNPAFGK